MGNIYEQQPEESAKAFAAFSVYLNLGLSGPWNLCGEVTEWTKFWSLGRGNGVDEVLASVERERSGRESCLRGEGTEWTR